MTYTTMRKSLQTIVTIGAIGCVAVACQFEKEINLTDASHSERQKMIGETCVAHSECLSARCEKISDGYRCTAACESNAACPNLAGWSCGGSGTCECTPTGKKPNVCAVDGDCDGQPDKVSVAEVCNDEDDDCNGTVDDIAAEAEGAAQYYPDGDKDTYGDASQGKWACHALEGWVTSAMDCNDDDAAIHPKAKEVCGNALDEDCDGEQNDIDVCGVFPKDVQDVHNINLSSGTVKLCGEHPTVDASQDVVEIVAKQDLDEVKFTIRLRGSPVTNKCQTYKLTMGTPGESHKVVYVYRIPAAECGELPMSELYLAGVKQSSTTAEMSFNQGAQGTPGHVAYTLKKNEFYSQLPSFYELRTCVSPTAKAEDGAPECAGSGDSCQAPVRR